LVAVRQLYFVQATFRAPLVVPSPSSPYQDALGDIQVSATVFRTDAAFSPVIGDHVRHAAAEPLLRYPPSDKQ
jgi:hypothetical protein